MINKLYRNLFSDPLYKNSIYVMASTALMAAFGFFFWILIARYYSVENIGLATALISMSTLISGIGLVGLNIGLMKYLPKHSSPNELLNSVFTLVISITSMVSIIFLLTVHLYSPQLLFIRNNLFYAFAFIIFMNISSINLIFESIFIALREAQFILFKNTILSTSKLIIPLLLIPLGAYGIFTSVSIATLLGVLFALILLIYKFNFRPKLTIATTEVKKIAKFSLGNYLSGFLFQAPALILPLIIINHLGSRVAAYYYIDTMILNLLTIIPLATTQVLLSEGSHNEDIKSLLFKSIKIITLLLIPAIAIFFFFGNIILTFFGKDYAGEAFQFLRIISFSAFFISIINISVAVLRILHSIKLLVFMGILSAFIITSLCYLFIPMGLIGIGLGWLIGHGLSAIIFLIFLYRIKLLKR